MTVARWRTITPEEAREESDAHRLFAQADVEHPHDDVARSARVRELWLEHGVLVMSEDG